MTRRPVKLYERLPYVVSFKNEANLNLTKMKFIISLTTLLCVNNLLVTAEKCLNCEATWFNGTIIGDQGCFEGTFPADENDKGSNCYMQTLALKKDGLNSVYNIYRRSNGDNGEPEWDVLNYSKFVIK